MIIITDIFMEAQPEHINQALNSKSLRLNRGWRKIFSEEEDQTIYNWVELIGKCKWKLCAQLLDGKTEKQVRDRWFNNLDPSFHCSKWNKVEDYLILKLYTLNGAKWTYISNFLEKRCASQVKNRFYGLLKKSKSKKAENTSTDSRIEIINQIILPYDSLLIKKGYKADFTDQYVISNLKSVLGDESQASQASTSEDQNGILESFENVYDQEFNNYISNEEELDEHHVLLNMRVLDNANSPSRSYNSFFV